MKRSGEGALSGDCVPLSRVLQAFGAPLGEQQAWALLHQAAQGASACLGASPSRCRAPSELDDVLLIRDGSVHPHTFCPPTNDGDGGHGESEIVVGLALVVYRALDFGEAEGEERLISPDLESLIADMTNDPGLDECNSSVASADLEPETEDDEGIERDEGGDEECDRAEADNINKRKHHQHHQQRPHFTLESVIQRCRCVYGGSGASAAAHFQAVVRALLAEAVELATFLERVKADREARKPISSSHHHNTYQLDTINFSDWARFWIQVIGELRMGVKLKKVEYSRTPIEYELTPYEILMDDIRSRRYKLRPLSEEDKIPPMMKKTMHDLILDFIRSRPPLRKASERIVHGNRVGNRWGGDVSPRDALLAAIRRGTRLRPATTGLKSLALARSYTTHMHTAHITPEEMQPRQVARRLIKVDFDRLQQNISDEEEEDENDTHAVYQQRDGTDEVDGVASEAKEFRSSPRPAPRTSTPRSASDYVPKPWKRTAYDLATQCESRRASMRRHASSTGVATSHVPPQAAPRSMPHSRPDSRQSHPDTERSDGSLSWSRSSLQDDLVKTQDKVSTDDRVSLTLEEVVHIRSVLTQSELENLPVENNVKEEVFKKKICFLCLKTRFTLFGPWGHRCKLCKKTVCQKCHTKMRIPMEHFSTVPVVLLSPSLLPSPEEDAATSFPRSLMARLVTSDRTERSGNCVGSTPSSPIPQRSSGMARSLEGSLDVSGVNDRGSLRSAPGSRGDSSHGLNSLQPHNIMTKSYDGPRSMPFLTTARGDRMVRSSVVERLRGTPVSVCNDCRDFVLKVIRASQVARADSRHRALQHLTLDLQPVYNPQAH